MKISYAITVCNEVVEIQKLIPYLLEHKRNEDNIVVLYDSKNGSKTIEQFLRAKSINGEFSWYKDKFEGHFADWKNKLTNYCTGDYIFQIDADETMSDYFLQSLPTLLDNNSEVDIFRVPRINTVEGLTSEHIQKWRWQINDKGWINFPDYQWRIYKNNSKIKWKNKVHEILDGYDYVAELPAEEEWCLYHPKTIEKQEKQNNYYNTL